MSDKVEEGVVVELDAEDYSRARTLDVDHDWYKRAVFYEVLVRAFSDSDRDGTGDLRGLTSRLDYPAWLGVDCLWLPPFYDSPLRDGGYDIRDFRQVLPEFGTVEDFVYFLDEAHRRGLRVITDLVMNHTSDQHPWFEESRRHPEGPYGDYYVWSDDDSRYADARVIFVDTETSNWTWDPVRGKFYWHRFFSHQPDLNYDNPDVAEAMIDVLRFWLDLGIDGFRLDAVPYLGEYHELGGTNPSVLAYMRTHGEDIVLCVDNMSRFPQPVELDLSPWVGCAPHELTGGVPFPAIGELAYLLTLPGHGFYWFSIAPAEEIA